MKKRAPHKQPSTKQAPRRRPRLVGQIYTIELSPRWCAAFQLLEAPYVVIPDVKVPSDATDEQVAAALASPIYRVLAMMRSGLAHARYRDRIPPIPVEIPNFFTMPPEGGYRLWVPHGFSRPATRAECEGQEIMAIWDYDNLVDRLRQHFLEGGYRPPAHFQLR